MKTVWGLTLAALLAGCATISYLQDEYGSAPRDGEVTIANGDEYWVWLHKQKPKIMVVVSAGRAAGMGMAQGLTFGAIQPGAPQPHFEEAAQAWLVKSGKPDCKPINPKMIQAMYWDFDIACPAPTVAAAPRSRARPR